MLRPDDDEAVAVDGNSGAVDGSDGVVTVSGNDVLTDDSVSVDTIGSAAHADTCELSPKTVSSALLTSSLYRKKIKTLNRPIEE